MEGGRPRAAAEAEHLGRGTVKVGSAHLSSSVKPWGTVSS